MQRTLKIKISVQEGLVQTIIQYNQIKQEIIQIAQKENTLNKNIIHQLTYKKIRKQYSSFPSALIQTARDVAIECLKQNNYRNKYKNIKVNEFGAIRLDKRNIRVNLEHQLYSISSINGRIKGKFLLNKYYTEKYLNWSANAATLKYKNNELILHLVVEKQNIANIIYDKVLGIDRGINNILVCSNNQFFNSKKLKAIKGKYQYLKTSLQSKGTRSAKRKLKIIAGKEQRFVRDLNHQLSKTIVNSQYNVFALEELQIKKTKKLGKKFNKKLGNWSYGQFEQFLEYKAEELGKLVLKVNPAYTSQKCNKCGYIKKINRNGSAFECKNCGYKLHADLNAAKNIAQLGISELSRVVVNNPNVTINEIATSMDISYKPLNSFIGN